MMACTCTDNGLIEFPSALGCILVNGYNAKHGATEVKNYLGNKTSTYTPKPTINVNVILTSNTDMAIFAAWYYTEILQGTVNFLITMPIFGVTKAWEVKLLNGLEQSLENDVTISNVKMNLELVSDIASTIEDDASSLLCAICGN